jgi:hypothetical protein
MERLESGGNAGASAPDLAGLDEEGDEEGSEEQGQQQQGQGQQELQQQQGPRAGPSSDSAFRSISDALRPPGRQSSRGSSLSAAAAASAAADAAALAWADAALTKAACFRLLSALAHGNSFAKNSARQAAVFELLSGLMASLQPAVAGEAEGDAASAAAAEAAAAAVAAHMRRSLSRAGSGSFGRHWRPPSAADGEPDAAAAPLRPPSAGPAPPPVAPPAVAGAMRRAELQLLAAASQCCADLCQGNHTNQDTMAAEGLIERIAALLAATVGAGLPGASRLAPLLTSLCDALGAAAEFHAPNKRLARETGAADALARLLLLAGAAPPGALRRGGLPGALSAGCGAVLALVRDCEDNQRVFTRHSEGAFLPALFRLMAAGDPELATQAAK